MTDFSAPLPSRRAQRESRASVVSAGIEQLPSRRTLRQAQAPAAPALSPARDPGSDLDHWVVPSSNVGQTNAAVATLHVEQFPTGEIAGPIDHTGEIILTGPIRVVNPPRDVPPITTIDASVDVEAPGIPRRATEALSIIGRAGPINEKTKIPSVGQGISAGFATFFGLLVITLIGLAFFTELI